MKYKIVKRLLPAAFALSVLMPGNVMAAPESGQAEEIIFTLKRITKANYDYQVSLNAANTANQSSITTPVPLKGNLQGALGIFTCYTVEKQTVPL